MPSSALILHFSPSLLLLLRLWALSSSRTFAWTTPASKKELAPSSPSVDRLSRVKISGVREPVVVQYNECAQGFHYEHDRWTYTRTSPCCPKSTLNETGIRLPDNWKCPALKIMQRYVLQILTYTVVQRRLIIEAKD